jgi:DNA-dependent protein kinase catalytic subunit
MTLNSIRKPKRLTLYGSNEKKYMFLVKGGEDVRLDQRIEELFNLVNRVLKDDPQCSKRALEIKRF